jgi:hypothetical protein
LTFPLTVVAVTIVETAVGVTAVADAVVSAGADIADAGPTAVSATAARATAAAALRRRGVLGAMGPPGGWPSQGDYVGPTPAATTATGSRTDL